MSEQLNAEQYEQLRRKQLYDLQEAAAVADKTRACRMVFRARDQYDHSDAEYIWVPVEPYESLIEMVARNERALAERAQKLVCSHCAEGSPLEWLGWDSNGRQQWGHAIQVEIPAPEPSLIDRIAARLGYSKERIPEFETQGIPCPSSPIIQEFQLARPPTLPGVNTGAYPAADYNPGFGDPECRIGDTPQ